MTLRRIQQATTPVEAQRIATEKLGVPSPRLTGASSDLQTFSILRPDLKIGTTEFQTEFEKFVQRQAGLKRKPEDAEGKIVFSPTQKNKGAANAGLKSDEFSKLDTDVQNFYVNLSPTRAQGLKDEIENVRSGATKLEEAIEYVNTSGVSEPTKQYLVELFTGVAQDVEQRGFLERSWDFIKGLF